jgi:hypothetical protein
MAWGTSSPAPLDVSAPFRVRLHVEDDQLHFRWRVIHLRHDVRVVDLVQRAIRLAFGTDELELERTVAGVLRLDQLDGERLPLVSLGDVHQLQIPRGAPSFRGDHVQLAAQAVGQRFDSLPRLLAGHRVR